MENHQLLLSLYNELDLCLREYYGDKNYSNSVIMKFIKELDDSGSIKYKEYAKTLNMIRVIRNDLIHELDMNSKRLIEINDTTIQVLKDVIDTIKNPIIAYTICTKFKKISFMSINDLDTSVLDLIKQMRSKGYSQLPILDQKNVLFGIFSSNVLFDYIKDTNGDISSTKLSQMKGYLPIEKHFSETYLFVEANANIRVVSEILIEQFKNNKKPAMIFVTQHGNAKEPVMGIIVASDIISAYE